MPCRLCLEDKPLRKSHIFPEWLYERLYDEKHRYFVLSTDPGKHRGTRPKGLYEKMLCGDCETLLSVWEGHAREVFYSRQLEVEDQGRLILFHGVDYTYFKLFQMSLLWRAAVSGRPEIPKIVLGPHEERMRRMLLRSDPGEVYDYGVITMLPQDVPKDVMQEQILPPDPVPVRVQRMRAYRAVFGGMFWVYIVSKQARNYRFPEVFLSKQGVLPVVRIAGPTLKFARHLAVGFREAGMLD